MKQLDNAASSYLIGAGLGGLEALAFLSAKRGLGITTAFENLAAMGERRFAPDLTHINQYLQKRDEPLQVNWEMLLVLGVAVGSYLTAKPSGEGESQGFSPIWTGRFGSSRKKRYMASFLGGALMMIGGRMAKGCTSGHALTGNLQLALSSWVFTPLMFTSAALTARGLYGKGGYSRG